MAACVDACPFEDGLSDGGPLGLDRCGRAFKLDRVPGMIEGYLAGHGIAVFGDAIPAALTGKRSGDLGAYFGDGDPESGAGLQGWQYFTHDAFQLCFVDCKNQCEIDLFHFQQWRKIFCKRQFCELLFDTGRNSLDEQILFVLQLQFF